MFRDSLGLRGADLSRALADLLFGGVQGQVQVQVPPGRVTEFSGVEFSGVPSVWTWGVDWVTHVFRRCSMQSAVCAIVSALVCLGGRNGDAVSVSVGPGAPGDVCQHFPCRACLPTSVAHYCPDPSAPPGVCDCCPGDS